MTAAEKLERRKRIVEDVRSGRLTSEVADEHGVCAGYVEQLCRTYGVAWRRPAMDGRAPVNHRAMRVVALAQSGNSLSNIAQELDITYTRVHQIVQSAREAGVTGV